MPVQVPPAVSVLPREPENPQQIVQQRRFGQDRVRAVAAPPEIEADDIESADPSVSDNCRKRPPDVRSEQNP